MTNFQYQNFGRQFGGRGIPWDECSKVLNSFALNKTPGNDGLPIEYYPTFLELGWGTFSTIF